MKGNGDKMKKSITWQLGVIIVCVIFVSMVITTLSNYYVNYKNTYEAAGIEAVGCANITTGLVDPSDLEEILKGNKELLIDLENKLDWTTDHKRIFEAHYVLSLNGTIIAADSNIKKQGFNAGEEFFIDEEVLKTMKETNHPQYSRIYEFGGMERITGYAPIYKNHDPNNEVIAINAIDFNAKIVKERTWDSIKDSILLGILPMLMAGIITIWLIRRKTKPIIALINYAQKIATGDLSSDSIKIQSKDEIGDLANTLNRMAENLRDLISQVRKNAEQVASAATQLEVGSLQSNEALKQVTEAMNEVAMGVDKQVASIDETSHTIHNLSTGVQNIATSADHVSTRAMDASEKAAEGSQSIKNAVKQMNMVNETFNELSKMVKGLGERSKEIGQIIEVITGIAEQTNLLALNAAIEAARAGDQGRGFAVVAEEVRKLAEQSGHSSKEISQLIIRIREETNKVVQSMDIVAKEVHSGINVVNTAGTSFTQIEHSVNDVTHQIQEVSSAVQQIATGTEQIVQSIQLINEVGEEAASLSEVATTSAEEQLASIEEISSSAKMLSKMAEELQNHISKFKI